MLYRMFFNQYYFYLRITEFGLFRIGKGPRHACSMAMEQTLNDTSFNITSDFHGIFSPEFFDSKSTALL